MNMTIDSLQLLQQLAARGTKSKPGSSEAADGEDYRSVLARLEAGQKEWQQTLDTYDLAKYTITMTDSFWTNKTGQQDLLLKRLQRQQQQENQQSLNTLMTHLMTLQRANLSAARSGSLDAASARSLNQEINRALQGTFMLTVLNMNLGASGFGSGFSAAVDFSKL